MDKKQFSTYAMVGKVGSGSFAKVYSATKTDSSVKYAVKQYSVDFLQSLRLVDHATMRYKDGMCLFENESKAISLLVGESEYIESFPKYYEIVQTGGYINIVMDLSEVGGIVDFDDESLSYTLSAKIVDQGDENLQHLSKKWMLSMVEAVKYLHLRKITHLDIKLENFLLFGNDVSSSKLKLIDFNTALIVDDPEYLHGDKYGTILYGSPESYSELLEGYDPFKADVWALGVCIYVLFKLKLPFHDESMNQTKASDNDGFNTHEDRNFEMRYSLLVQKQEPDFTGIPEDVLVSLKAMLEKDPVKRLTISQVFEILSVNK
jgi:NIMA (never in mitosis gene a)-related kinase